MCLLFCTNFFFGLLFSKLSGATILINYDGSWVNSTYQNCKTKAILVTDQITLEELQNKVYDIINVEPNEYEITMIVIYESVKSTWLAEIADDNDVRAFIFESLLWYYKMPLCISLKRKASNKQAPSVDFGQESRSVNPNLGTQADLKDDLVGNENLEGTEYKVENNTTELGEFLREKDMAFVHVDADNMFQDNAEFNELPPANTAMCNLTRTESGIYIRLIFLFVYYMRVKLSVGVGKKFPLGNIRLVFIYYL